MNPPHSRFLMLLLVALITTSVAAVEIRVLTGISMRGHTSQPDSS